MAEIEMADIDRLLEEDVVIDFMGLYDEGKLTIVGKNQIPTNPITPETPNFEKFTQREIKLILEVEGS